jgi:phosphoenolpyruvate carboxykinase (ATP)
MGVTEPEATFSACSGAAFLAWPPAKYAEMLAEKMRKHNAKAWLVNTGITGGAYGKGGGRMNLKDTRAIINAIHAGELDDVETVTDEVFRFEIPTSCPAVSSEILQPRFSWEFREDYDIQAEKLARLFIKNFEKYEADSSDKINEAGPKIGVVV